MKTEINNNEKEKIFNSKFYNNILNNDNNSNINLLFGIKIKNRIKQNINEKNISNIENDSTNKLQALINFINESYTKSVGTNTIEIISYNKREVKKSKKRRDIFYAGISRITNFTSNSLNSNLNSMLKIDKTINIKNYN